MSNSAFKVEFLCGTCRSRLISIVVANAESDPDEWVRYVRLVAGLLSSAAAAQRFSHLKLSTTLRFIYSHRARPKRRTDACVILELSKFPAKFYVEEGLDPD